MERKYEKSKILIPLLLLFTIGCTPKIIIMVDGQPAPTYAYILKNPQTGLSMEVIAAKFVEIDEEGETVLWPIYLNVDEISIVDPDSTRHIKISVKIRNPNKVQYELHENVLSESQSSGDKSKILTNVIYKGRLRNNNFDFFYCIDSEIGRKISFTVKDKNGLTLFIIGDFSYKPGERGDADQEEVM